MVDSCPLCLFLRFSDVILATILATKSEMCGQKFELKIDNVRFVGHPTLLQHALGQVRPAGARPAGSAGAPGSRRGLGRRPPICCLHPASLLTAASPSDAGACFYGGGLATFVRHLSWMGGSVNVSNHYQEIQPARVWISLLLLSQTLAMLPLVETESPVGQGTCTPAPAGQSFVHRQLVTASPSCAHRQSQ